MKKIMIISLLFYIATFCISCSTTVSNDTYNIPGNNVNMNQFVNHSVATDYIEIKSNGTGIEEFKLD